MRSNWIALAATALLTTSCSELGSSRHQLVAPDAGSGGGGAGDGCTLTQGFWKNHEEAWPVATLTLGTRSYTQAELLAILREPVRGNGLVSLAHQLIAAKLNVAAGADDTDVASAILAADLILANLVVPPVGTDTVKPSETATIAGRLDDFNNGAFGPGHCDDGPPPPPPPPDAGPDAGPDAPPDAGCTHSCPTPSVCGNGIVEGSEECDDGNTLDGDSCSSACVCTCPIH